MARRYSPPPTWPRPPRGWVPEEDWVPPADFPPLPEGWKLWLDEGEEQPSLARSAADGPSEPLPAAAAAQAKRRSIQLLIIGGTVALVVVVTGLVEIVQR